MEPRAATPTLYERMEANLFAAMDVVAAGSASASVQQLPGATAAVFPTGPESAFYNNAVLTRGLGDDDLTDAVNAVVAAYSAAGVDHYAVWAHESESASRTELERRGYHVDTCTRAMAMSLDEVGETPRDARVASAEWQDYLPVLVALGAPEGTLAGVDPRAFDVVVGKCDGVPVAAAIAYDHDGDCGIYNVGTLPHARRHGLATALTWQLLHNARECGCVTASLQATPEAEHLYAALGFRDLGRFVEYVP